MKDRDLIIMLQFLDILAVEEEIQVTVEMRNPSVVNIAICSMKHGLMEEFLSAISTKIPRNILLDMLRKAYWKR